MESESVKKRLSDAVKCTDDPAYPMWIMNLLRDALAVIERQEQQIAALNQERGELLDSLAITNLHATEITNQLESQLREANKREHDVDEEWLSAIGTAWMRLTGKHWETRDGETRDEGLNHNIGALFQHIEELGEQLRELEAHCAAMREALQENQRWLDTYREANEQVHDLLGWYRESSKASELATKALSTDAGKAMLERLEAVEKERGRYKEALEEVVEMPSDPEKWTLSTTDLVTWLKNLWKVANDALHPAPHPKERKAQ